MSNTDTLWPQSMDDVGESPLSASWDEYCSHLPNDDIVPCQLLQVLERTTERPTVEECDTFGWQSLGRVDTQNIYLSEGQTHGATGYGLDDWKLIRSVSAQEPSREGLWSMGFYQEDAIPPRREGALWTVADTARSILSAGLSVFHDGAANYVDPGPTSASLNYPTLRHGTRHFVGHVVYQKYEDSLRVVTAGLLDSHRNKGNAERMVAMLLSRCAQHRLRLAFDVERLYLARPELLGQFCDRILNTQHLDVMQYRSGASRIRACLAQYASSPLHDNLCSLFHNALSDTDGGNLRMRKDQLCDARNTFTTLFELCGGTCGLIPASREETHVKGETLAVEDYQKYAGLLPFVHTISGNANAQLDKEQWIAAKIDGAVVGVVQFYEVEQGSGKTLVPVRFYCTPNDENTKQEASSVLAKELLVALESSEATSLSLPQWVFKAPHARSKAA